MEYSLNRIIDLCLEGIFVGFGLSMLLFYLLTRIDRIRLKSFYDTFIYYSLRVVRIVGLIYFVYFIYLLVSNYSRLIDFVNGDDSDAFYTIFFIIRSLLIVLLSQLFWYKKIRIYRIKRSLIATALFVLGLFSNYVIEKYILFTSQYYMPSDWQVDNVNLNELLALTISSFIIERIILFSAIVFVCWTIFKDPKPE